MVYHQAYGRAMEDLDVVVVEDAKPMQTIIRSILHALKVARVRCFDGAEEAFRAMVMEPPSLLVTDWHMEPVDGLKLIRAIRHRTSGSAALVPAIIVTAHPTRKLLEAAVEVGAHFVLAKPLSPAVLQSRVEAILHDTRGFELDPKGSIYRLEGREDAPIVRQQERWGSAVFTDVVRKARETAEARKTAVPEPQESGRGLGFAAVKRGAVSPPSTGQRPRGNA